MTPNKPREPAHWPALNRGTRRLPIVLLAALVQTPAMASEYRGSDWGILFLFYTLPFALIPIGLSLLLTAFGFFRNRTAFRVFAVAASLPAVAFLTIAFRAPGGAASTAIVIAEVLLVFAATLALPWWQRSAARAASNAPKGSTHGPPPVA